MLDLFEQSFRGADVEAAVALLATTGETGRGAFFTKPEIVDAILDLCNYTEDAPLHLRRLLEPAFGAGDFLLPAVGRLLAAYERRGGDIAVAHLSLGDCIRGVELHDATFRQTRTSLCEYLIRRGITKSAADRLCAKWLIRDDFLLTSLDGGFNFVVGNPPYVRQERIPDALLREYRRRFRTLYDRADLYVPFFERALDLLSTDGILGYICANRWLKNRYGGPLREKISHGYWLRYFIDMENVDAFHAEVIAYPAITVIQCAGEGCAGATRTVSGTAVASGSLPSVVTALLANEPEMGVVEYFTAPSRSSAPLLLGDASRTTLLRRIEREFPSVEDAACRVGIGVATGCDRVYVDDFDSLPVEDDRKLPLVMARDLRDGKIVWGGKGVLNPFDDSGRLVLLQAYPRLARYFLAHRDAIAARNVARRDPAGWYRTIDRIQPGLLRTPKILVPDIKGEGVFVVDNGSYYPHHNLYFITSAEWDLHALRAVLRSSLTLLTIATYCTRMAGGFLRFQAQYLRRIRIPLWSQVDEGLKQRLIAASGSPQLEDVDELVDQLYGLSPADGRCVRAAAAARYRKTRP